MPPIGTLTCCKQVMTSAAKFLPGAGMLVRVWVLERKPGPGVGGWLPASRILLKLSIVARAHPPKRQAA